MSSLIGFEIKKFCNRKKNLLVIGIFIILSVIFIILNSNLEKQLKKSEIISIDLQSEAVENALANAKDEIIRLPENEKIKEIASIYVEELDLLKEKKKAYVSGDFNKYLQCTIQLDKNLLNNIANGNIISGQNIEEISNELEINTILLEKNIEPIYTSVSMQGFNFIMLFFNSPISIILVILIIILSADVVSSEFEYNTYKLLFTQPISKMKIILSKIVSTLIMINLIVFGIIAIYFCVLGFIKGFGSINYPIKFYNNGVAEYISIGKFILFELMLAIIIITFTCFLSIAVSAFTKSISNSIAVTIIITVSAYMISSKGFFSGVSHLNPFVYIDISNVLQGHSASLYQNINISFKYGTLIIGLLTIILLIASIFIFEKNKLDLKRLLFTNRRNKNI